MTPLNANVSDPLQFPKGVPLLACAKVWREVKDRSPYSSSEQIAEEAVREVRKMLSKGRGA